MNCQVFKSPLQADTYLYLPRGADIDALPESLMSVFGAPEKVMDIALDVDSRLAQADAGRVIQSIEEQGFYLQLPPNIYENKHNPWA